MYEIFVYNQIALLYYTVVLPKKINNTVTALHTLRKKYLHFQQNVFSLQLIVT